MTETARTFPVLGPGEHVCWLVRTADEFARGAGEFLQHGAANGDKTLVIGPQVGMEWRRDSPAVTFLDPGRPPGPAADAGSPAGTAPDSAMLRLVRREIRLADREGFRGLRVLARMESIAVPGCGLEKLVEHELGLQEFAAGNAASVVCAYRQDFWEPALLHDLTSVHLRHVGSAMHTASFRVTYAGAGAWALDGAVDMDGARAFAALLRAVLARGGRARLHCEELELIDAAGLRVLRNAVVAVPGSSIRIEGANDTIRKAWVLSGYAGAGLPVELAP